MYLHQYLRNSETTDVLARAPGPWQVQDVQNYVSFFNTNKDFLIVKLGLAVEPKHCQAVRANVIC